MFPEVKLVTYWNLKKKDLSQCCSQSQTIWLVDKLYFVRNEEGGEIPKLYKPITMF